MRKQPVNIYFILYLAAIVILITDIKHFGSDGKDSSVQRNIDLEFRIKPEKLLLNCRIKIDSSGNRLVELDSINYILFYGNISDIRYEFKVEEMNTKSVVYFTDGDGVWFKTKQEDTRNRIKFIWKPNIQNFWNSSFTVYVTASAIVNNESRERITTHTQFSLVISNNLQNNDITGDFVQIIPDVTENPQFTTQNNTANNYYEPLSDYYSMMPKETKIKALAGQEWMNEITIYGLSLKNELKNVPNVKIQNSPKDNMGSVYNPIITDNSLIIKGKTPVRGTSNVYVSIVRDRDSKEIGTQFLVEPILYGAPIVPKVMYPGVEYNFSCGLSKDLNNISVYIKKNNEVILQHFLQSDFKFSANNSDIGKQFSYERYVNGQLVGQKYYIDVIDFPEPEITRVSNKSNYEIVVETVSFGTYNNRENTIKELAITGNGKAIHQYGQTKRNRTKLEFYEQFLVTPIDNDKPFQFEATAIDQRGIKSNKSSINYK